MFDEVLCGSEQRQYYQKSIFVQQIMALSEHLTLGFKSQWEE